jgi:hypothetical protein
MGVMKRAENVTDQELQTKPGVWNALTTAASQWMAHKSAKAGAALAYYSIFSIGPLIIVVISIATLVLDREGVQQEVTGGDQGIARRQRPTPTVDTDAIRVRMEIA